MFLTLKILHLEFNRQTVEIKLDTSKDPSASASIGGQVVWRYIRKDWKPWQLVKADVDGDGKSDFIIALNKLTRHAKFRINTLFVFAFNGETVVPKWRGSSMGRDFLDFRVVAAKGGDRILTIDKLLDGNLALASHKWNGFGFQNEWEKGHWKFASFIQNKDGRIGLRTSQGKLTFAPDGTLWK